MITPIRMLALVVLTVFTTGKVYSDVFSQEAFKTHLRWNFVLPKDQVTINKQANTITIDTLNLQIFEQLTTEMTKAKRAEGYVEAVAFSQDNFPAKPARVTITLKDESVELFSFYRDVEKKWILDFWVNADVANEKAAAAMKTAPLVPPVAKKRKVPAALKTPKKLIEAPVAAVAPVAGPNPGFRDFRYGAAFLWSYPPMLPPLERDIHLESRIPDDLYPVRDRDSVNDPKEAHMQLSINLYRQEKWGLLNKSLELYRRKYGEDVNQDINEWLRVNALLRSNIPKQDKALAASAMNILTDLLERTKEYELKRAAFRYLLQHYLDRKDYFRSLELAKKFFVEARGQFDHDMVILSANTILQSLARLHQVDKITEFLSDKKLAALLPAQTELAYSSYALLSSGQDQDVIKRYRASERNLAKPVHPAILYNVAEAMFREASYTDAAKIFDGFLADWAHLKEGTPARLRVATIWELTEKPAEETLLLYRNAVDRAAWPEFRYEAKLRYVGMRLARKITPDASDLESEVFLDQAPDEKKAMDSELKKLLWLVRLRIFINTHKYDEALAYLTSLPIDTLKPADRRMFEGDGAEVVFGLIQQSWLKEEYAKAVRIWEVYRERYDARVAGNPFLNFVVADCFIKLGLHQSFERAWAGLQHMRDEELREYPIWVPRSKELPLKDMLEEMSLIQVIAAKDWDQAEAKLASFPVSRRDSINFPFYLGVVAFHRGKWQEASEEFERVLIRQNPQNRLTPHQMAELLMGYVESLYKLKDVERFKTVVKALAQDVQQSKSASILNVAERVSFLLIETLAGEAEPEWNEVGSLARSFGEKFPKSPYSGRIQYLLGRSLIGDGKMEEGKKVLTALVGKKDVPGYVREMARTELSALEIKSKKL